MDNKKLGGLLLVIGLAVGGIVLAYNASLQQDYAQHLCTPSAQCQQVGSSITLTNIAFGVVFSIISLGFYMLFFTRGEEALLRRLEEEKTRKLLEEKYSIIVKVLDESERKVLEAIREQDGIGQNTLRLRTGLSKAKVSQVLSAFEKKQLIRREAAGKTYSVFLTESI
jgi:uncharacterized membrane protein